MSCPVVDMILHGDHGSAWRRRQRRLRSWWRHEQQSVAMALSAAAHHSFGKVAAGGKYDGLRAQRTDRAEKEEEVREAYVVPRGAAGRSERAGAAAGSSHGRLRGCSSPSSRCSCPGRWRRPGRSCAEAVLAQEKEEKRVRSVVVGDGAGGSAGGARVPPAVDPHSNLCTNATSWTLPPGSSASSSSGRKRKKRKRRRRWPSMVTRT